MRSLGKPWLEKSPYKYRAILRLQSRLGLAGKFTGLFAPASHKLGILCIWHTINFFLPIDRSLGLDHRHLWHTLMVVCKCCTISFLGCRSITFLYFNFLSVAVISVGIIITCVHNTFNPGIMMVHFLYFALHIMSPYLLLKDILSKILCPWKFFL